MTQVHPHPEHHRDHHLLAIITAVIVAGWMIFPPGTVELDDQCHPDDIRASVSALVTQGWFWERQLTAIKTERDHLLAIQNRGEDDQDLAKISPIESRMDRLSRQNDPHDTSEDAKQAWLQERQTDRIARIAVLMQCANRIERTGRGG